MAQNYLDNISLPVRYDGLTESDLQAHLRYCAAHLPAGNRAEFLLGESRVVVPIVRRVYKAKRPTLDILIRSGSVGRDRLTQLKDRLSAEGYSLRLTFTARRKVLGRIIVPLVVDDGMVAVSGLNVLRIISADIGVAWPCTIAVGYALGSESRGLPGRMTYREPHRNAGHLVGSAVGKLIRKVIP